MNTENFTKILILENEIEAQLLDDILTEQDIPHIVVTYHDSAYDGIYQTQKGWGHVDAPAEYADKIKEIYANLPAEEELPEPGDEEMPTLAKDSSDDAA